MRNRSIRAQIFGALGSLWASSSFGAEIVISPPTQDIWTTSYYAFTGPPGATPGGGQANPDLVVGGWGDLYYSLLKFDLNGLPQNVDKAQVQLYKKHEGGNRTPFSVLQITSSWDWTKQGTGADRKRLWWSDQPSTVAYSEGFQSPSDDGTYTYIDVTGLYKGWKSGLITNEGIELRPQFANNNYTTRFASSREINPLLRPALVLTTSVDEPSRRVSSFSFPIKSENAVFLNTESGGKSVQSGGNTPCGQSNGYNDPCHDASHAYYSLDFDTNNGQKANVIAAGSGKIVSVNAQDASGVFGKCTASLQGCIIIDHGNGLYTEYREYKESINPITGAKFAVGDHIEEGTVIGTLNGINKEHLHFQVESIVSGSFNSKFSNTKLEDVTVGNRLFKDYKLGVDPLDGHPTQAKIYGQLNPLLPTTSNPYSHAAMFNIVVGDLGAGNSIDDKIFIDPVLAIGYDYKIISGPMFSSVFLPNIGDGIFELWLWDSILEKFIFSQSITANKDFLFLDGGVDRFRILGIEVSAGLDPENTQAFITGLTFASPGSVNISMTSLTASVPEPANWALMILGFAVIGLTQRRRALVTI